MIAFRLTDGGSLELAIVSVGMRVRDALRDAVPAAGLKLLAYVKARKLSGSPLRNRSGRLRRDVNLVTRETPRGFTAQVGTSVEYGARHEFGFSGTETVREHLRTMKMAFGRPIAARKVQVRTFVRTARTPERSFLRAGLRELQPELTRDIERAVTRAAEGRA